MLARPLSRRISTTFLRSWAHETGRMLLYWHTSLAWYKQASLFHTNLQSKLRHFPARGDASIPTTRPHRPLPYTVRDANLSLYILVGLRRRSSDCGIYIAS